MNNRKWLDKYSTDLKIKYNSDSTIRTYLKAVTKFLLFFNDYREPKEIPNDKIKRYFLTFTSHNSRKHMHCAVARFYEMTVGMPAKISRIPYPKKVKSLPRVIDTDMLRTAILGIKNIKHKAILMLTYTCALRRSEVINLKIDDIDSARAVIHINNSKGSKDRIVKLSDLLLKTLREYYKIHRPEVYLFNSTIAGRRYSASSCGKLVKRYVGPDYSMHTLRHSGATSMLENGTDVSIIQKMLGHSSIKTTMIYTHISTNLINQVQSPM